VPSSVCTDDSEEAIGARDAEFAERKRHFERLRDGFLETVLGVSGEAVRFEESTAHGAVPGGFKYNVHGVLKSSTWRIAERGTYLQRRSTTSRKTRPPIWRAALSSSGQKISGAARS
jgi:hypothetical protein